MTRSARGAGEAPRPSVEKPPLDRLGEQRSVPAAGAVGHTGSPAERARQLALTAFCTAYFFIFGGMVGSFLNVVAWRMPRGENILWPGSRCPKCATPIRLRDNVPILSWLWLRGRCRACAQPISVRYVAVEAVMAVLFLGLAWWELLSGGRNLPVRPPNQRTGVTWILWETQWDLVGIYAYHCCLLSLAMVFVLIALDRRRVPRRLLAFTLGVGFLIPLLWPPLRPAPFSFPWDLSADIAGWLRAAIDGAAGLAAGLAMGLLVVRLAPRPAAEPDADDEHPPAETSAGEEAGLPSLAIQAGVEADPPAPVNATIAILTSAGVYLGWQAGLSIGLFAVVGIAVAALFNRAWPSLRRVPPALNAAVGILALLAGWRWLFEAVAAGIN